MDPDDIQQIGRIISVLTTAEEKLENIMKNSGEGTDAYDVAESVADKVDALVAEVADCLSFHPGS